MKKILAGFIIIVYSVVSLAFIAPTPVRAADCTMGEDSNFLSFPTWFRGLGGTDDGNGGCKFSLDGKEIGPVVFVMALNVIDIILRLIGIIAVGFVIWGGFQYIISRGEPERTKSAITTIRNAIIGMVIAMVAAIVVSFIVGRLSA